MTEPSPSMKLVYENVARHGGKSPVSADAALPANEGEVLMRLLDMLANPEAASKRLKEWQAAADKGLATVQAAAVAKVELAKLKDEHDAVRRQWAEEEAAHEQKMQGAEDTFKAKTAEFSARLATLVGDAA